MEMSDIQRQQSTRVLALIREDLDNIEAASTMGSTADTVGAISMLSIHVGVYTRTMLVIAQELAANEVSPTQPEQDPLEALANMFSGQRYTGTEHAQQGTKAPTPAPGQYL